MKTDQQIRAARSLIVRTIARGGLSPAQLGALQCLSAALQWACGDARPGNPVDDLLSGRKVPRMEGLK